MPEVIDPLVKYKGGGGGYYKYLLVEKMVYYL